jgi:membrane associated rhomboid family serine protease
VKKRSRIPYITLLLISISLAAAFAVAVMPDWLSVYGFRSDKPNALAFFTNVFLHANTVHLLGNLVFLAAVGVAVELAAGAKRYLAVFTLASYLGVLVHWLVTARLTDSAPLVGMSGGIAGCAAYYGYRYSQLKVVLAPNVGVTVKWVIAVWIFLQIVGAFVRLGDPYGAVAFWAHLGGAMAGIMLSLVFQTPDLKEVELGHEVLERMNERGPAALLMAAQEHIKKNPGDVKGYHDSAKAYALMSDVEGESKMILKLLEMDERAEQVPLLKRLHDLDRLALVPPVKRMMMADAHRDTSVDLSILLLSSVIAEDSNSVQRPDALLSLASLAREADPARYERTLDILNREYPLHPATEVARTRGWLA